MIWWWLSFCDPARPDGSQFLGVAIVQAPAYGVGVAAIVAAERGCNPGGEVRGTPAPPDFDLTPELEQRFAWRVLSKDEAKQADIAIGESRGALQ